MDKFCQVIGRFTLILGLILAFVLLLGGAALLLWPEQVALLFLRAIAFLAVTAGISLLLVPLRR